MRVGSFAKESRSNLCGYDLHGGARLHSSVGPCGQGRVLAEVAAGGLPVAAEGRAAGGAGLDQVLERAARVYFGSECR